MEFLSDWNPNTLKIKHCWLWHSKATRLYVFPFVYVVGCKLTPRKNYFVERMKLFLRFSGRSLYCSQHQRIVPSMWFWFFCPDQISNSIPLHSPGRLRERNWALPAKLPVVVGLIWWCPSFLMFTRDKNRKILQLEVMNNLKATKGNKGSLGIRKSLCSWKGVDG